MLLYIEVKFKKVYGGVQLMKKVIGLVLILIVFILSITTAYAATISGKIYFEVPEEWAKTAKTVYCHIWIKEEVDYAAWQTEEEIMTKEEGNKYSFDIPEGEWNMVVFSTDAGMQTYDLYMGNSCIGDTVYVTETVVQNPLDSESVCNIAHWRNNKDKHGPA